MPRSKKNRRWHKDPVPVLDPASARVRDAYRQDKLTQACLLPESKFGRAFEMETVKVQPRYSYDGRADYYHFRDNGSPVLAVAHLDTVVPPAGRTPRFCDTEKGPLITSGALDDRLGAYVILHLLPALGVTHDWLLTTGEESCQSTAEHFKPPKDYDWVIEFDRMGTDVVMYQYEDRDSRALVEAAGAELGSGSFSDIAVLEHLGVKAFNWGVGYQGNYHSEKGYAYLDNTFSMVAKYLRFCEQNAGKVLLHQDWKDEGTRDCSLCMARNCVDAVTWYCDYCGCCQDCYGMNPEVDRGDDPDTDVCQCYTPGEARHSDDDQAVTWEEYMAAREPAG